MYPPQKLHVDHLWWPSLFIFLIVIGPRFLKVCVYGATGAGKSSLLMACLQELVTLSGRSLMNGSVAFASQRAWIQNATVRLLPGVTVAEMDRRSSALIQR